MVKKINKKGLYPKRLRDIYCDMKQRCYNPKVCAYKWYGNKGIIICNEWLDDKNKFLAWAINNGYSDELTIDRIDSNGNYEPDNCRWATWEEQALNRSNNILIEYNGEVKTISQWSQITGIPRNTLYRRFEKGKDIFEDHYYTKINIEGQTKNLKELSEESGIPKKTILYRYNNGYDSKDLLNPVIDDTKHIEINGKTHTATEWAEISGLTREIILMRMSYGWKNEDLLKPPKFNRKKKYIEIEGESHTIDEWCNIIGIKRNAFHVRIKKGLKGKELISPKSNII